MRRLRLVLAIALLIAGLVPAGAATRALLFGVSEYPHLPPGKNLNAPANDIRRMQQALLNRGVPRAAMTVLADGVDASTALPTREAILAALTALVADAAPGDLVIIYGTGHGSRQKSASATKIDGLDQVFLPRDGEADSGGRFRNAILSVEFGQKIEAIRRRGADVWFLLDSCFSGGGSRAAMSDVREKMIDPGEVGMAVATTLMPDQQRLLAEAPPLPPGAGKLIAFYASQPNETAREVALPANIPLARRSWGSIFTLALTRVLQNTAPLTYRQVMIEAARQLRADPAFQARQTPSFEGDGLDTPVLNGPGAVPAGVVRVQDGELQAGQLDGFEEGAVVSLHAGLGRLAAPPLAEAVIARSAAMTATLAALPAPCGRDRSRCPPPDAGSPLLRKAAYARLTRPAPGAALRLAPLKRHPVRPLPEGAMARAQAALDRLLAGPMAGAAVQDESAPDIAVWATAAGLRFSPAAVDPAADETGPLVPVHADGPDERLDEAMQRALWRARQVKRLQTLSEATAGIAGNLSIRLETQRFGPSPDSRGCAFAPGSGRPLAERDAVTTCDRVTISVENTGRQAIFPAVFFLDDGWNIIARRPSCPVGLSVADRLDPGRVLTFDVPYRPGAIRPGLAPATANGVLVFGIPFQEGEAGLPNLCGLQQHNDRRDAATRAAGDDENLDDLLAGTTRSGRQLRLSDSLISLTFWPVAQPVLKSGAAPAAK